MYSSPNIIWVMKSRRMSWAGYIPHMLDRRIAEGFWWTTQRIRDHMEDISLYGRITLKWIFGLIQNIAIPQDKKVE
jgi:hypothetical protein